MSIANLSVKIGSKNKGRSAVEKARYVCRLGKFQNRGDLVHSDFGHMPSFAKNDPMRFWKAADNNERANSAIYTEHVLTLPRDLDLQQQIDLIDNWAKTELKGKAYQYAIHHSKSTDGKLNPHAHLFFSERLQDNIERTEDQFFKRYNSKNPDRGGCKKEGTGSRKAKENKQFLIEQRQRFEQLTNEHLQRAKSKTRISLRSYKNQGLLIAPSPTVDIKQWHNTEKRNQILEIRALQKQLIKQEKDLILLESSIPVFNFKSKSQEQYEQNKQYIFESMQAIIKTDHDLLLLAKTDLPGFLKYSYLTHFNLIIDDSVAEQIQVNDTDKLALQYLIDAELRSHARKLNPTDRVNFQQRAQALAKNASFDQIIAQELDVPSHDFQREF